MALEGNGQLLVRRGGAPGAIGLEAAPPVGGDYVEPLFPSARALAARVEAAVESTVVEDRWVLVRPVVAPKAAVESTEAAEEESPWDLAHEYAERSDYRDYVEPDIKHKREIVEAEPELAALEAAGPPEGVYNKHWKPDEGAGANPAWHLQAGFTGFATVRHLATGAGVRIAHLDTGYAPTHVSKPRNLKPELGRDYWSPERGTNTTDPGTGGLGLQPGHGTGTLAILAGGKVKLTHGGQTYEGDFGGAPDAEVVPVRICPSVIHLWTSTMAKGLDHALAPNGDASKRCDVVTLSHGGAPTRAWAAAVNRLYDAGIIVAAASGDSFNFKIVQLATRYTVYPAAFNRVITVLGATYDKKPYVTDHFGEMQGCWGPASVMWKAVSAYTPNVPWMSLQRAPDGWSVEGAGTSSSTPQVAAACALWLQLYGDQYEKDWTRVEACRLALWGSAAENARDREHMGWGILNVPDMLDAGRAARIKALHDSGNLHPSAKDSVSFAIWRLLSGKGPPDSEKERMYETEVAQVALSSRNTVLIDLFQRAESERGLSPPEVEAARQLLLEQPISRALAAALREAA